MAHAIPLDDVVSESPIRDNALHLSGSPLAHLSTQKIFAFVSMYAPTPLGEIFLRAVINRR